MNSFDELYRLGAMATVARRIESSLPRNFSELNGGSGERD